MRIVTYIIKSILTITILIGIIIHGKTLFHKSNPDIILDTDSEYSRIWIRKINKDSKQIYTLEADKGYESISTNNGTLYSDYMKYYDLFDWAFLLFSTASYVAKWNGAFIPLKASINMQSYFLEVLFR